ncbi:ABC transporter permease [Actinoplanes sp. TRM 88003]|uniref:ABC transporter permease n=1 Tax=Paractinoplanes aksuensis TaxID=2939490 RepID=A0ABT1DTB3_9ACTN|nr:ABC transporter permease [Actinoplanes aksuensis]MCO8274089.1 ABC transporter permease [Actinoplanes aksuensis]
MYFVALNAVRQRSGPTTFVAVLAALLATVAGCAVWYGLAVASRSAGHEVASAPIEQRVITVRQATTAGSDPRGRLDAFAATVGTQLPIPAATPVIGAVAAMSFVYPGKPDAGSDLPVAYRDGFCAHVRLTGSCPAGPGEAAVSADSARRLGLAPGDRFQARSATSITPLPFRVAGIYEPIDPVGAYWSDPLFRAQASLDPFFTPLTTFSEPSLGRQILSWSVEVPAPLLRGDGGYDLNGVVNTAGPRLAAAQLDLTAPTGALVDRVREQKVAVARAVAVAAGQLIVLAWFAIGLAGRLTGRDRRADAALVKLRGGGLAGVLRLALGHHLLPLAAGSLLGWVAGFLVAWPLAGRLPVRAEWWLALLLSGGSVLATVGVGLLILLAGDALAQRAPVVKLLRTVPSARRDWRSVVVDLALLALTAGAVLQARTGGGGLGLAAPALVALSVGLVLARLLRGLADRTGAVALRAGRIRLGLITTTLSRRPGHDRVFALLVLAVANLALTVGTAAAGHTERVVRADVELGAPRVLTVAAASRTELLHAVRAADPAGRYAMAAVVDTAAVPPVLAVDSGRLARVATWRSEYGPVTALPAGPPSALPLVTGDRLTVRVSSARRATSVLGAVLQHERTGQSVRVEFRDLRPGPGTASAAVPACRAAPGCRFVGWELSGGSGAVTIAGLAQHNPVRTVLDRARLGDMAHWRGDFSRPAAGLTTSPAGLVLATGPGGAGQVAAVDSDLPLPIVLAGPAPGAWSFDDAALNRFGDPATPVRVVGRPTVLPVIGRGVLTDLDSARRIAGDSDQGGTLQVWLTGDAPAAVVDALGLPVLDDRTAAGRTAELAAEGSVVTGSLALFTALTAVLLAAALYALGAAVDRKPQLEHLHTLRVQGLARRVALSTAYAGAATLAVAGLLGGVAAALVAGPVAAVAAPPFPDGWAVIAPPDPLTPAAPAIAALTSVIFFGAAAWFSARRLRAGLR